MLEHAWTRERSVLRHVPDEYHRDPARLRELHDPRRHLADLADGPRRTRQLGRMERLHGVDHARLRRVRREHREDLLEAGLRDDRHAQRARREPLRAQPHLLGGLLAAHVQGAPTALLEVAQDHVRECRLADPGRAAEQHQRPAYEPPAEHPVELADPGREALRRARPDVG